MNFLNDRQRDDLKEIGAQIKLAGDRLAESFRKIRYTLDHAEVDLKRDGAVSSNQLRALSGYVDDAREQAAVINALKHQHEWMERD